jgi:G3E family GTPase
MAAIPVTIIGGYLGAGKTTLVNHLLSRSAGRRLAVVVNEFGTTTVDREAAAAGGGDTVLVPSGCVCCSGVSELVLALAGLSSRPVPPHQILIETSGVADVSRVAEAVGARGLRLDAVLVLADAEAVRSHGGHNLVGAPVRRQLAAADLIVLNKTDLVSELEKLSVTDWISELVPMARVVETSRGRVPEALVLAQVQPTPTLGDPGLASWAWTRDAALDGPALRWWTANLPHAVLRGRGVLQLREDPVHRYVFQLVGVRWTLERDAPWGHEPPRSYLVLIGRADALDRDWLDMTIARCVAGHAHLPTSA